MLGTIGFKICRPCIAQLVDSLGNRSVNMFFHAFGYEEFDVFGPPVTSLGESNLLIAEWLAMSRAGVLLMRRAVTDVAVNHDQCRCIASPLETGEQLCQSGRIVRVVQPMHRPAIGAEASGHVFAEGKVGLAFDADLIVV